jgi:small subunit ribosomal protein S16
MPTTIRLQRTGRKAQASFRIVVSDSAESRDGPEIETIGTYNPRTRPSLIRLDAAAALNWLHEGALPSDTVDSIFRKTGVGETFKSGATAETLEESVIELGPPEGERGTSRRAELAAEAQKEAAKRRVEEKAAAEAAAKKVAQEAAAAKKKAEEEAAAAAAEPEAVAEAEAEAEVEAEAAEEPVAEAEVAEPEAASEEAAETADAAEETEAESEEEDEAKKEE